MTASDFEAYSARAYCKDRALLIVLAVVCATLVFGMGIVLALSVQAALLLALVVALFALAAFVWDYLRRRTFYRDALLLADQLERAYQLPSVIERPDFLEGALAFDIADAIACADAAELTRERAAAANNAQFVELWTHEVKTPISAARLILQRSHGVDALALRREIDRIDASCERALYSARVSNLTADYQIREASLAQICHDACKELANLLIERGIAPSFDLDESATVLADKQWVKFVVKQVVSNSAKYGSTSIVFSATVSNAGIPAGCTVLEIADDGIGIPTEDLPRVFEQGFSGTNGRADGSSTGMGLYLVAQICRTMGVGLSISSDTDQGAHGTTVALSFPHDRSNLNLTKA